jgi:hypothetical protein
VRQELHILRDGTLHAAAPFYLLSMPDPSGPGARIDAAFHRFHKKRQITPKNIQNLTGPGIFVNVLSVASEQAAMQRRESTAGRDVFAACLRVHRFPWRHALS